MREVSGRWHSFAHEIDQFLWGQRFLLYSSVQALVLLRNIRHAADYDNRGRGIDFAELTNKIRPAGAGQDVIGYDDAELISSRAQQCESAFGGSRDRYLESGSAEYGFADTQLHRVVVNQQNLTHAISR